MTGNRDIEISHLERRKIEGRVLIPLLQELAAKFGKSAMLEVLGATIDRLATEDAAPALKKRQLRLGLSPGLSRRKLPAIERLKRHGDRLAAKLVLTDDLSELIEGKIDVLLRTSAQPPPGLHVDRIELQTVAGKPLSTTLVTLPGLAGCRAHRALVKQLVSA